MASTLAGFVLGAGLGTRIAALSRFRPKPLFPVGASTPLARAVDRLRLAGAGAIVANAAHLADQIVVAARALAIDVVVEEAPTGTAGGLAAVRDRVAADLVAIWNGDIVAEIDPSLLVGALALDRDALGALAVRGRLPAGSGNVGVDETGAIVRIRDRAFGSEAFGSSFAAVHVLRRELVERAPGHGCLVADLFHPMLAEGARLIVVETAGAWFDVGDLPSYLAANLATIPAEDSALVASDARVAPEVSIVQSVVGAGASVAGRGPLERCVVWPGASAEAPLARSVVTPQAVICIGEAA
jgi:NDP-sugar pyrophosphorylase family protein